MTKPDLDRLVPLSPDGTDTPLFCVHASSGSAYSYLGLAQALGPDRPVYGLEAPGFDDGREPVRSLPDLAAEYARTLREFRPDGDVLLLGWSLGGIIALDTARRLAEAGRRVRRVVMIDVSVPRVAALPPEKEIAGRFLDEILATAGAPPDAAARGLAQNLAQVLAGQPADASAEAVFQAAENSGALPDGLDAEFLAERYEVFRALVEASYGFEVTGQYHGPVTHLIATESWNGSGNGSGSGSGSGAEPGTGSTAPPDYMRWDMAATDLTELTVPGGHHTVWTGDNLPRLAALVRTALEDSD